MASRAGGQPIARCAVCVSGTRTDVCAFRQHAAEFKQRICRERGIELSSKRGPAAGGAAAACAGGEGSKGDGVRGDDAGCASAVRDCATLGSSARAGEEKEQEEGAGREEEEDALETLFWRLVGKGQVCTPHSYPMLSASSDTPLYLIRDT